MVVFEHDAARRGDMKMRAIVGSALASLLAATTLRAEPPPPVAPVRVVEDTFYGETVRDPYRWLEDLKAPEVQAWMKAHADRSAAALARIPGRAALLDKLLAYDAATPARVGWPIRVPGDLYFYEKRGANEDQFKLMMRRRLDGAERLLFDPETLARRTGKPHAINYFTPSPDGRHIAYGVSAQGSEAATLHVVETASGRSIGPAVSRADFGNVDWSPDGRTLVFNRLQLLRKGAAATDKYQHSQVWRLPLGAPLSKASAVFGTATPGLAIGPADLPFVSLSHDGRWAFGLIANGTQREIGLFVAAQAGVLQGKPQWHRLFGPEADVTGFAYRDGRLVLLSHAGAPRFKLLALELSKPRATIADATELLPQSDKVLTSVVAAADGVYVAARVGNLKRLYRLAAGTPAAAVELPLPLQGSFELVDSESGQRAADPRLPGVLIDLQGWTRGRQYYEVRADGRVVDTGLQPQGRYDAPQGLVVDEVLVPSHDGATVPMSIIHRQDLALDGRNPTLLYGYGSYGVTEEPFFNTNRLAWIDAGYVFAVANPRGTSVYGDDWYKAGFQATKPNTWKDFIACAEYLVAHKYTEPSKLGIWGGSAGGILVGRAMTERPELFAAVVAQVGALDMLRFEFTANGVPNIPEFGSVKSEAGFRALLAMSTYANIRDGIAYPATMFTHGVNDPRVEPWESTKTAARLMAATSSGKPVLLRLDYDAGHGVGNTRRQYFGERADVYAFLLWQMGVPDYQPR
jgi:prolyl oligopeptidase